MKLLRICKTCEFNFKGICASGGIYGYGEKIIVDTLECDSWDMGYDYFKEVCNSNSASPWYVRNYFISGQIWKAIELWEKDTNGEAIEINIYDAINEVFDLVGEELSVVLDVSRGVIGYARNRETISRRKFEFSNKLGIPSKFFDEFTSHDLEELEKYKEVFIKRYGEKLESYRKWYDEYLSSMYNNIETPSLEYMNDIINKIKYKASIYQGLKDNYKSWEIIIEIQINIEECVGNIYHRFTSYSHLLEINIGEEVSAFFSDLDCEAINCLNDDGWLLNDMYIHSHENGKDIILTLFSSSKEKIDKIIPWEELANYVADFKVIHFEGLGKKKERRKCIDCLNFNSIEGTAKGYCNIRNENVQRSRVICAFDFISKNEI